MERLTVKFLNLILLPGLLTCFLFSACIPGKKPGGAAIALTPLQRIQPPLNTVFDFLKWHRKHLREANVFVFVNRCYSEGSEDISYSINFEETEKFLLVMKQSSFFTDKYIEKLRTYFHDCDEHFHSYMAGEFSYAMAMISREYEENLQVLESAQPGLVVVSPKTASVELTMPSGLRMKYLLEYRKGVWCIEDVQDLDD
ncbi:MAG TPA: hypothetical protein VNZ86_09315 [Bacteroidia bacterium]|jgi:hypothetical protein|nr:hypothetical protein [Bacteroidia bacterium]